MINDQLQEFAAIWKNTWDIVGRGSYLTDKMISEHYRLLSVTYSLDQIRMACDYHASHATTGILPKDVNDFFGDKKSSALEAMAGEEFNRVINSLSMLRDVMVFANARTAYATRITWGSLSQAAAANPKYRDLQRKTFVTKWTNADPAAFRQCPQVEVLDLTKQYHTVGFIGDPVDCRKVCKTSPELSGINNLRFPDDPNPTVPQLEGKIYNGHSRSEYPAEAVYIDRETGTWLDKNGYTHPGPGDYIPTAEEVYQEFKKAGLGAMGKEVFKWLKIAQINNPPFGGRYR